MDSLIRNRRGRISAFLGLMVNAVLVVVKIVAGVLLLGAAAGIAAQAIREILTPHPRPAPSPRLRRSGSPPSVHPSRPCRRPHPHGALRAPTLRGHGGETVCVGVDHRGAA